MSATVTTPPLTAPVPPGATRGRVTQVRVIRSEWTKLWSLRSTRWTLLVAILGMAGLGPLIAAVQMNRWDHMGPDDRLHFNPINTGLGGWHFAQLAIGVLGVLVLTGEYSTGQIRSTFMAVPKRLPVLSPAWRRYSRPAPRTRSTRTCPRSPERGSCRARATRTRSRRGAGSRCSPATPSWRSSWRRS